MQVCFVRGLGSPCSHASHLAHKAPVSKGCLGPQESRRGPTCEPTDRNWNRANPQHWQQSLHKAWCSQRSELRAVNKSFLTSKLWTVNKRNKSADAADGLGRGQAKGAPQGKNQPQMLWRSPPPRKCWGQVLLLTVAAECCHTTFGPCADLREASCDG
jgi:hypothetical protein